MNPAAASHRDLVAFHEHREVADAASLSTMRAIARTEAYLAGDIATEAEYYRAHFRSAVHRPEHVDAIVARLRAHFSPASILTARAIQERLYEHTWQRRDYDLLDRLRGLGMPMLVIHGRSDFFPLEVSAHIAEASAGTLVVLEACGHFAYLESPAAVHEAVERFLRRAG